MAIRAGSNALSRFRSLGDGQVDFGAVFSKMTANNFDGWAVVEWECALKHPEDGAREGAEFVAAHIIRVTEKAFDDFAEAAARIRRRTGGCWGSKLLFPSPEWGEDARKGR